MFVCIGAFLVVPEIAVVAVAANEENEVSKLLNANVEALARDEISATTCLGVRGACFPMELKTKRLLSRSEVGFFCNESLRNRCRVIGSRTLCVCANGVVVG